MKNYFLPALIWAFAVSQSFAQKAFAPSLRPYADGWSQNVKRLLNHAGFDLRAEALRSPIQLDSTKTYYGYNQPTLGDSTPLHRSNYTYPSANTKVEINYQWENDAWLPLSRTTLVSDGQQRIITALSEAYDPESQKYEPDSRLTNFPHGDSPNLIDSFFVHGWDTIAQDWMLLIATRNAFNAQDQLMESASIFNYFGVPVLFKDAYLYDVEGNNHLIEQYALFDGSETPTGRTEISYVDHLPIEVTAFASDGIHFFPSSRTNYAYTLFGALRLELNFEWKDENSQWALMRRTEYRFDGEQRLSSKETTLNPTSSAERELIAYSYTKDDKPLIEMFFNWDDDLFDWVLDSKKRYYYSGFISANPDLDKALALQIAPNPTSDAVRLTLENEALVQVFSHSGQLLQSRLLQPGQVLNLVDLPTGIYQVVAQQGSDYHIGKVLKQ